jgi:hypothetical protein
MTIAEHNEAAGPPLERLLVAALPHRLHIGLTLVARVGLTPLEALTLTWDAVDPVGLVLHLPDRDVPMGVPLARLLHWHACRQRVDALIGGFRWDPHGHVVTDRSGRPYSLQRADEVTRRIALEAGLPPSTMRALRHPVWQ